MSRLVKLYCLLAAILCALVITPAAMAASYYWDTDGATPGATSGTTSDGTWSSSGSALWSTSADGDVATPSYTTTSSDDLYFAAGTDSTGHTEVTISGAVAAQSITLQEGGWTFRSAALPNVALTIDSGATLYLTGRANAGFDQTVSSLSGAGSIKYSSVNRWDSAKTLTVNQSTNTTFSGIIDLRGPDSNHYGVLKKQGAGTLTLSSATAAKIPRLQIDAGVVSVSTAPDSANTMLKLNGGILELGSGISSFNWTWDTNTSTLGQVNWGLDGANNNGGGFATLDTGGLTINAGGANAQLHWRSDANGAFQGTLYLGTTTSAGKVTITNPIGVGMWAVGTYTVNVADVPGIAIDAEFSGAISLNDNNNNATLAKAGAGTLLVSSNGNTSDINAGDAVQVNEGRLLVGGSTSTFDDATITVAANAYLGGNGYTGVGTVTINAGGGLAPGASAGTLTVGSSSANANLIASGMNYEWEWNNGSYDSVTVKGTLTLNAGTYTLKMVDLGGIDPNPLAQYTLFSYTGSDPTQQAWTVDAGTTGWTGATVGYDAGNNIVYVTNLVPEPGTLILLAAGAVLTVLRRRRHAA